MTDTELLRSKIEEKGLKLNSIASQLGLTYYALSLKISNKSEFKAEEIQKICTILSINSLREKENIFFKQ